MAPSLLCIVLLFSAGAKTTSSASVQLKRVPDGGIQPEAAVDQAGTIHLVYFKGDPAAGDLFYVRSRDGSTFSDPIRVNSVPGTAVAIGNIRGARIAVGRWENVYVAWNGSAKLGEPSLGRSPMLFSRLTQKSAAFEPERNLIHIAYGINGGGGVAADQQGRVYVFWHAPIPGRQGEAFRRVWVTRSEDDGRTFGPERVAWDQPTGACGCCSLDAYSDRVGNVYVLFRSAEEMVHRNMYLLESTDHGATFRASEVAKWNVGYCVMSSEAFAGAPQGTFAAWESDKRVQFGKINPKFDTVHAEAVSDNGTNQKYPALAVNRDGFVLVAWTEGMGWKRGGSVHWQVFSSEGERTSESGAASGVPAWSLVAAYALPSGNFVLLY